MTRDIDDLLYELREAQQSLLDERAVLLQQRQHIDDRLKTIDAQLAKLELGTKSRPGSTGGAHQGGGQKYEYVNGTGFVLVNTNEVIGPGKTQNEAIEAVKKWCQRTGKTYYATQWRRIIDPKYGHR